MSKKLITRYSLLIPSLPALNQARQLPQRIKRLHRQLGVVNVDAEGVFDEEGKVNEVEGVHEAAGDQGVGGGEGAVGLFEDVFGDVSGKFGGDIVGHRRLHWGDF